MGKYIDEQVRVKDKWINELLKEIEELKKGIEVYKLGTQKMLENSCGTGPVQIVDTCQKCGCNEFLCGHNRKE